MADASDKRGFLADEEEAGGVVALLLLLGGGTGEEDVLVLDMVDDRQLAAARWIFNKLKSLFSF
jgi:hypothetical protein